VIVAAIAEQDRGVGHSAVFAATASGIPAPLPFPCFTLSRAARAIHEAGSSESFGIVAAGVGHGEDEDALASVGSARVGRSKHRPLRIVPERGQVSENVSELH